MNYRYLIVGIFFSSLQIIAGQNAKNPTKKEKLKTIPTIPELSPNIKDPSKWKNDTRLIFFYSPWCEHSNNLRPLLYDVIEEIYYRNISGIWVGQIDVSVNSDVARMFRIKNTPTLLLYRNGTRYEFDDDHTVEKIVEFVSKIMSSSLLEIHSYRELKKLQMHHSVLFLLVYDEEIDPDWEKVYEQVSKERILMGTFLYTLNTTIPQELGLSLPSLPRLLVLKDDLSYQYTDTLTKYRMTLWVENEQFPALPFTNRTTFRPIVSIGNVKRLAVLYVSTISNIPLNQRKAVEAIRRVALGRKLHSGYQFVVLDDADLVYAMTSGTTVTAPALFVWDKKTGLYYLYESRDGFSEKPISTFLFSITSGKIKESGGLTVVKLLTGYYWMTYNLIQAMISHRPLLSVLAIVCFGVGLSFCLYTRVLSKKNQEFKRRLNITRALRRKKRNAAVAATTTTSEQLRRRRHIQQQQQLGEGEGERSGDEGGSDGEVGDDDRAMEEELGDDESTLEQESETRKNQ